MAVVIALICNTFERAIAAEPITSTNGGGGSIATTTWQSPPKIPGDWSVPSNWSDGVPTADVRAVIDNGGTALIDQPTPASASQLHIGEFNRGQVVQSGATVVVTDFFGLVIGVEEGSEGTYELVSGQLLLASAFLEIYVGNEGLGRFEQTGGDVFSRGLRVGEQQGAVGWYAISDGAITVRGDLRVGNLGEGHFLQSGGDVEVDETMRVGNIPPGHGEYLLEGGSLTTDASIIGSQSAGDFRQTGGVHSAGSVQIGSSLAAIDPTPFSASYTLSGDALLDVAQSVIVGNGPSGEFRQESGRVEIGGPLIIGAGASDGTGSYKLNDGELTADDVTVGAGMTATFDQLGGTHSATTLQVGIGTPNFVLPGPTAGKYNLVAGNLFVDEDVRVGGGHQSGQPADFNQTGGVHRIGGDLIIGPDTSGPASYNAVDGSLHVGGDVRLGLEILSEGVFRVIGGDAQIAVAGNFVMGPTNQFFQNHELAVVIGNEGLATIDVAGNADLRGRLNVGLVSGFTPTFGTTYEVLSAQSGITGDLELVGPAAEHFELLITSNSILLTSTVPEPSTALILLGITGFAWLRKMGRSSRSSSLPK